MGEAKRLQAVCLICAVTYNTRYSLRQIKHILLDQFGAIHSESALFPFDFTDYYSDEMGPKLYKIFFSFETFIFPEELVRIKLATNALELKHASNQRRNINVDPGYIEPSKLVLATTKNYDHRIYLGDGIYGDVHLRFRNGVFSPLEWTYPDYRQDFALSFFTEVRYWYLSKRMISRESNNV